MTNISKRIAAFSSLCVLSFPATAFADNVYKCVINGSTVFSQEPCSKDPKAMKQIEIHAAPAHASTQSASSDNGRSEISKGVAHSQAAIDESNCIDSESDRIYAPANARIAEMKHQIAALENQASYAKNNLAGATYEAGLRQQMGSLEVSISNQQAAADSQMSAARQQCADARKKTEDTIDGR